MLILKPYYKTLNQYNLNFAQFDTTAFELPVNEFIFLVAASLKQLYLQSNEKKMLHFVVPELTLLRESFIFSILIKSLSEATPRHSMKVVSQAS